MLLANDTSTETKLNVFKMLRCNGKLGEFIEYVRRRRGVVMGGRNTNDNEGCCVVYGESFTTKDLDLLIDKLKSLSLLEVGGSKKASDTRGGSGSGDKDAVSTTTSSGCSSSQEEEAETTLIDLSCSEESGGFG